MQLLYTRELAEASAAHPPQPKANLDQPNLTNPTSTDRPTDQPLPLDISNLQLLYQHELAEASAAKVRQLESERQASASAFGDRSHELQVWRKLARRCYGMRHGFLLQCGVLLLHAAMGRALLLNACCSTLLWDGMVWGWASALWDRSLELQADAAGACRYERAGSG